MEKPPIQPPQRPQIKVEVPADLSAQYVNFALITHTLSEIVLDFAQMMPNMPKARVQTRLVLTPTNAKLLLKALGDSLAKYEERFGEIKVPPTLADQLFSAMRAGGPGSEDTGTESGEGNANG
jgi:hypothetical protein